MGKTYCTQFHATTEELIEFVRESIEKYHVHATALHAFPFSAERVTDDNLDELLMDRTVHKVVFTEILADLTATGGLEFMDRNPAAMVLDVGRLVPRGLEESSLSTMEATPLWKKIATDLKRKAPAGVIGTSEKSGDSTFYRDHRVTAGAKALSEQGIALRQFAQSSMVFRPATKEEKR